MAEGAGAVVRRNLVLCGFMGCGKTTLGKLAAGRLGMEFVDMDDEIVRLAGAPVAEIFRVQGEDRFRDWEHRGALELGAGSGRVIATGGGALAHQRNVGPLRENGLVVYLNPGFAECFRRIARSDRPLVRANTRGQLERMYQDRDRLYRQASHEELRLSGPPEAWVSALCNLMEPGTHEI